MNHKNFRSPSPSLVDAEALELSRHKVRDLLTQSQAFKALPPEQQREIARHTVEIASYLAAPEGIKGNQLPNVQGAVDRNDPYAVGLAKPPPSGVSSRSLAKNVNEEGKFTAQAASEGARVAGALLTNVNFPDFVSKLITGVFDAIVDSSIKQMTAYGELVKSVAQTLNQFRDENVSDNQGRDHLVDQFPDVFQLDVDTGDFGEGGGGPRVRVRDGVDEDAALQRINNSLPMDKPLSSLDDDTVDGQLVQAARTQLATSRQQLLATMVLMGINRIVVTDGKISAKVMYDFQARDNMKFQNSTTNFKYDPTKQKTVSEGEYDSQYEGGSYDRTRNESGGYDTEERGANWYAKGKYKTTSEPVLTLASASQTSTDASLTTKASLAGVVEVNFKSDYLPLEKMADSFQIGMIQNAAKPNSGARGVGAGTPSAGQTSGAAPAPAASTPNT